MIVLRYSYEYQTFAFARAYVCVCVCERERERGRVICNFNISENSTSLSFSLLLCLLESDNDKELALKHQIIQDVVVNEVYLGGESDSGGLVETLGFGSGAQGYAYMQYVLAYHENDPLCLQYTSSSMVKIWQAAGLDLSQNPPGAVPKLPLSGGGGP